MSRTPHESPTIGSSASLGVRGREETNKHDCNNDVARRSARGGCHTLHFLSRAGGRGRKGREGELETEQKRDTSMMKKEGKKGGRDKEGTVPANSQEHPEIGKITYEMI